ncbi:hypothetical protein [Plantactinospora sp. GCM10030261]|uniref:hypothetical protein n=1 Tax=Plantactinospora sp. GCM10030261 TaxID=3273420 RepID=UPI003607F4F5
MSALTQACCGYIEAIYGVAPEAPLPPDAEPTPTPITSYEFARRWITVRDELGANQRST